MTRSAKLWLFGGGSVACFVIAAVIAAEMAKPIAAYGVGTPEATPTTAGIVQLLLSLAGGAGLSLTAIWQGAIAFLESRGMSHGSATQAVDFAKVSGILALVKTLPDGATKTSLILAGRSACDELRDSLFPGAAP